MENELDRFTGPDGRLIAYAWPGGYPVIYFDNGDNPLCPDCAEKLREDEFGQAPIAGDIFYEGSPEHCSECGREIESAYGDPDEDSREEI